MDAARFRATARRRPRGLARSLRRTDIRSLATRAAIAAIGRKAVVTLVMTIAVVTIGGCATERAYDGPELPAAERAIVHADPALSAGLPVQLRLRRVDEREIPLTASTVELPPGPHSLLVDCRVTESGTTQRFKIDVELEPGGEYRIKATASTRNCEAVELQPH